ncbi:PQQ-binding-like beta-propeller repeat protein [Streptomyces sp. NPDC015127]|uniref:outer membrane protein assembly factor BamB family protein n=1 Tax=Streptomyces sp. NPDC015127 TaxID=3364939 RepID=UPI0036FC4BD8
MTQPPPPPNQPPGPPPNQPPGPPNQPPQGGFGAPQQQPAGGFGAAPPPPPQDGAYGYPQTAPPAQPPYGQPPQTPPPGPAQPPYGYPQQGAPGQPQQGYGYPTQPMQPQYMPPQNGGSGRSSGKKISTQMQIIIAACVAIVLIVVGGIVYASTGDDGKKDEATNSSGGASGGSGGGGDAKPAPDGAGKEKAGANTKSKVAFQLPEPPREDLTAVPGSWVTDKAYVKPGVNSVVGYDVAKGSVLWTTPLAGQVCAASRHMTEDYKTAILFEAKKRTAPKFYEKCTEVGVIDLKTGKLLWSKSVAGDGDEKSQFEQVTQSGNTVAAGGLYGGAAFDLTTGAVRWKPKVDAQQCRDIGYGGGKALVAVRTCGDYDNRTAMVQPLNPDNGTPLSTFKMPAGVEDARVVSSDPLVVAADVGDTGTFGISDFFSIDGKTGKLRAKIAALGDKYLARCSASDGVEGCQFVLVGNDRLYLPTTEHDGTGDGGRTNEIIAFDLATGKGTSERADAGDGYHALPLRMDGGNLIVYKWPPYNKGGQVVSIDGATFKQTVLLENPSDRAVRDAETSFPENGAEYDYAAGRFFVSQDLMSKPRENDSQFGKKYLAVAFSVAD